MVKLGSNDLTLNDFKKVLIENQSIELSNNAIEKVEANFNFLSKFSDDSIIYGVNTGLGPMAQYIIEEDKLIELQYNLIRSHASGSGKNVPDIFVKAAMIARLNSLMLGYSGIHKDIVELLKAFINLRVYPKIPEHGGVGASGDLVQLAHLALALIGEGEASFQGKIEPVKEILLKLDLQPIDIHIREGLALLNGTSVMTGIGLINVINAKKLLEWSLLCVSIIAQIVESYDDYYSIKLNNLKNHKGQINVAKCLNNILWESTLIRKREDHLFNGKHKSGGINEKVQEYYSIRCTPQILGPIWDTIEFTEKILIEELNSVNDNPVIDEVNNTVLHGGNFHGDYISIEMDKLKIAVTKLSMLAERQLNFLLNNKLNEILPPFINLGRMGLNFGMQGMQFTATSTTAENQSLSFPMYVHSIPNNNDNQDIVSMGTNSAIIAHKVIENTFEVIAIELIGILQAVDYLGIKDRMSSKTSNIYYALREVVPVFVNDSTKYEEIQKIKDLLLSYELDVLT